MCRSYKIFIFISTQLAARKIDTYFLNLDTIIITRKYF